MKNYPTQKEFNEMTTAEALTHIPDKPFSTKEWEEIEVRDALESIVSNTKTITMKCTNIITNGCRLSDEEFFEECEDIQQLYTSIIMEKNMIPHEYRDKDFVMEVVQYDDTSLDTFEKFLRFIGGGSELWERYHKIEIKMGLKS